MSFEKLGVTENGGHIIIIFITATTETYAKSVTNLNFFLRMKCKINKYCLLVLPSKTVIWRPFYALFCLAVIYFADPRIQQIAGSADLSGPAFPFPALLYEDSTSSTIKLKRRIVRVFCGEFFHSMSTNLAQTHSPWPHPPFFVISNLILTSKNMRSRKTPQIATLPKSWKHNTSTP